MTTQRYTVTQHTIQTLITWVESGEIAIPEIQRPFVWQSTQVRDLLDSLFQGYPVGYLIVWQNPSVRLKDGSVANGKRILIDGQQRVTALMAALLGCDVLTKKYQTVSIRIAFHPEKKIFEVSNPAIRKDPSWISDISTIFNPETSLTKLTRDYCQRNEKSDQDKISLVLEDIRKITTNLVGVINLADDLDLETVTEIFFRVNLAGVSLSQADFVMSKIAVNVAYGGHLLRKAIDYFCHLIFSPELYSQIENSDDEFAKSEFLPRMQWLKDVNNKLYQPSYKDMLHVAFTSEFKRGRLQDLVALLSGRNFETRQYEEEIAEDSFTRLKAGIFNFMNKTHYDRVTMIIRSAGFITSKMIRAQNAVNFAYILYLRGRDEGMQNAEIERIVRRWYVMSLLRSRYSGSPETTFDSDIRQIDIHGLIQFCETTINSELSQDYWTTLLLQELETSSSVSPIFLVYQAAQVKFKDLGFLSHHIGVQDLLLNQGDVHHIYPRNHLIKQGYTRGRYNQIANLVLTQNEINIGIGDSKPETYFNELAEQCDGGVLKYGGISDMKFMRANFTQNCVPVALLDGEIPPYNEFLQMRRKLMTQKMRRYFESL